MDRIYIGILGDMSDYQLRSRLKEISVLHQEILEELHGRMVEKVLRSDLRATLAKLPLNTIERLAKIADSQ